MMLYTVCNIRGYKGISIVFHFKKERVHPKVDCVFSSAAITQCGDSTVVLTLKSPSLSEELHWMPSETSITQPWDEFHSSQSFEQINLSPSLHPSLSVSLSLSLSPLSARDDWGISKRYCFLFFLLSQLQFSSTVLKGSFQSNDFGERGDWLLLCCRVLEINATVLFLDGTMDS